MIASCAGLAPAVHRLGLAGVVTLTGFVTLAGLLTLVGCGSDGGPDFGPGPSAELVVAVRTVGDQIDADGYMFVLDDTTQIALSINAEIRISELAPGAHSFEITGVASNCRLTNSSSSGSLVTPADSVKTFFVTVFCLEPDPGRIFYATSAGVVGVMNALGGDRQTLPILADRVELSRDQERIVYSWEDDIWVADADGSSPINLTNAPNRGEGRPSWSPDGQRIAYMRNAVISGSEFDVFVMNADGSGVTNLTPITPQWTDGEPAWSPDGRRIAFRSHRSSNGDLWTMAPDGSQLTQLTFGGRIDSNPRWSPDGQKLVFARFTTPQDEGGTDFELYVIGADGTDRTQLTRDDRRNSEADWSPDGRWIVYSSADLSGEQPESDLFMMRADGTDKVQITFGEQAGLPTWVP